MEPRIIFEDNDILVLDKPAGMIVNRSDTTVGEKTVQEWVEKYLKIRSTKPSTVRYLAKHEIRNKSNPSADGQNSNDQNGFEFRNSDFEFVNRAGIVHRLDKETSGILLVAKNPQAFENLQRQFKERQVKKTYIALVHGFVEPQIGEINVPVGRLPWNRKRFGVLAGGREAVTKYKILRYYDTKSILKKNMSLRGEKRRSNPQSLEVASQAKLDHNDSSAVFTLIELYPETGRTHQIRVHLKYFNHPIFSDPLYAGRKTSRNDRKLLPRIFLHASKISFNNPKTGQLISFESPLPEQLNQFLTTLNS